MDLTTAMLGILFGFLMGAPLIMVRLWERPLRQAGLLHPNQMTDEEVQLYLRTLFRSLGYKVLEPAEPSDATFDFVLADGLGQKRGVVTRLWRVRIQPTNVDQSIGAGLSCQFEGPVLISLKGFSYQARQTAAVSGAVLWGVNDLVRAVARLSEAPTADLAWWTGKTVSHQQQPELEATGTDGIAYTGDARARHILEELYGKATPDLDRPKCPRCGKQMIQRRGGGGSYWSCALFPRCLGTRPKDGRSPFRVREIPPEAQVAAAAMSGD